MILSPAVPGLVHIKGVVRNERGIAYIMRLLGAARWSPRSESSSETQH